MAGAGMAALTVANALLTVAVDTAIGDGEFLVLSPTQDGLTVGSSGWRSV